MSGKCVRQFERVAGLPGVPAPPHMLAYAFRPCAGVVVDFVARVRADVEALYHAGAIGGAGADMPAIAVDVDGDAAADAAAALAGAGVRAGEVVLYLRAPLGDAAARGLAHALSVAWVWRLGVHGPGAPAFLNTLAALAQSRHAVPVVDRFVAVVASDAPLPPALAAVGAQARPLLFDAEGHIRDPHAPRAVEHVRIWALLDDPRADPAFETVSAAHWQHVFLTPLGTDALPVLRHDLAGALAMPGGGTHALPLGDRRAAARRRRRWLADTRYVRAQKPPDEQARIDAAALAAGAASAGGALRLGHVLARVWDAAACDYLALIARGDAVVVMVRRGTFLAARRAAQAVERTLIARGVDAACTYVLLVAEHVRGSPDATAQTLRGRRVLILPEARIVPGPDALRRVAALAVLAPAGAAARQTFAWPAPAPALPALAVDEALALDADVTFERCLDDGYLPANMAAGRATAPLLRACGLSVVDGAAIVWAWLAARVAEPFLPAHDPESDLVVVHEGEQMCVRRFSHVAIHATARHLVEPLYPGAADWYIQHVRRLLRMPRVPPHPADVTAVGRLRLAFGYTDVYPYWADSVILRGNTAAIHAWVAHVAAAFAPRVHRPGPAGPVFLVFRELMAAVAWTDAFLEVFCTDETRLAALMDTLRQ